MLRLLLILLLIAVVVGLTKFNLLTFDGGQSTVAWLGYRLQMPAVFLLILPVFTLLLGFGLGQMYSWLCRLPWHRAGQRYLNSHNETGEILLAQYVAEKLAQPFPKLSKKQQAAVQQPPAPQGVLYTLQKLETTDANSAMWEKWLEHPVVAPLAQLRLAARLAVRGDTEASQDILKPLTEKTKQRPPIQAATELYFTNLLALKQWTNALSFLQAHRTQYIVHHYAAFAILLAMELDDAKIYNKLVKDKQIGAHPDLVAAYAAHLNDKQAVKWAEKSAIYQENTPDLASKISGKIKAYREAYIPA